jgi:hypothetical protein
MDDVRVGVTLCHGVLVPSGVNCRGVVRSSGCDFSAG